MRVYLNSMMKISIITVVYNNVDYIADAIKSALSQDYCSIEYIVVDGGSDDGTLEIIDEYRSEIDVLISEPDSGVYDDLNKGISIATGEVISILHSDDVFCSTHVVSDVVNQMSGLNAELCFSDMVIVDESLNKVLRYYMANYFRRWMFRMGWMPPHPTCFINKMLFKEFGLYSLAYKVAGDFDFLVRIFYGRMINWTYLNQVTVKMRKGGVSNSGLSSKITISSEINRSLKANNVWTTYVFQLGRYFIRLLELFVKPKKYQCD